MLGLNKEPWQLIWGPNPYRCKSYRKRNARYITKKRKETNWFKRIEQSLKSRGESFQSLLIKSLNKTHTHRAAEINVIESN
jgi:hypothetical protein